MKNIRLLLFSILLILTIAVRLSATPTGDGGQQFPLGSSSGNNFDVGSGKLTVQGDTGNIGIGSTSPQSKLDINGTITASVFSGDGSALSNLPSGAWTDGGTNVYVTTSTDNSGIGTVQPNALLNISSSANQNLFQVDDNGNGDTSPFVIDANGNVGIGTTQPNNSLQVSGLIYFSNSSSVGNAILGTVSSSLSGSFNTTVGISAGSALTTGTSNVYLGNSTGVSHTSGNQNTMFGDSAGGLIADSSRNIIIGTGLLLTDGGSDKFYVGNFSFLSGDFSTVRVGIGTQDPPAMLSVGSTSQFQVNSSGNMFLPSGAVLTPSLSFTADPDTGMFSTAANTLNFATNGTERMRIDSSGNMGIGTNTLTARLIVQGAGTTTGIGFQTLSTTSVAQVTMLDNGNVGIGSSFPRGKLDVVGGDVYLGIGTFNNTGSGEDLYVSGNLEVDGSIYGDASGVTGVSVSNGWTDGGTNVYASTNTDNVGTGTTQPTALLHVLSTANQDLFRVDDDGFGDTTPFVIDANGNVGIGTTQPNNTLQVSGVMYFSASGTPGNTFLGNNAGISNTTGQYNTFLGDSAGYSNLSGSANTFIGYQTGYSNTSGSNNTEVGTQAGYSNQTGSGNVFLGYQAGFYEMGSNKLYITYGTTNPPLIYGDFNTVRVGIGTSDPPATLSIGTTSQFQVDSSGNALTGGGAVGAPSLSFTADTDTGMWRSGANTLDFSTAGAQRQRIDSNGNVGLTTTTMGGRLIVQGAGTSTGITFQTQNSSASALVQMFDNGNVGINSADPRGKLSVVGGDSFLGNGTFDNAGGNEDLYITGNVEVDGTIYGDGTGLIGVPSNGWSDGGTNVFVSTSTDNVGIGTSQPTALLHISSTSNQELFRVDNNGPGDNFPFIVKADGNVGIGTTANPANYFRVKGLMEMTNLSTTAIGRLAGTSSCNSCTFVGDAASFSIVNPASDVAFGYKAGYSNTSGYYHTVIGAQAGYSSTNTGTSGVVMLGYQAGYSYTGSNGVLFVGNSPTSTLIYGNFTSTLVGIGTTAPPSLFSVGTTSPFQVNSSGYALLPAGAVGAPALSFTADTDTGMWSGGANTLDFSTGGSERLKIDSSGNLGVGTTTLSGRMIVQGTGTTTGITFQTLNSSGTALVTMIDSGNVGINSANPRGILDVVGGDVLLGNGTFNNTSGSDDMYVTGNFEADGAIYGDGSGLSSLPSSGGGWTDGGTNVYVAASGDNLGIGTSQPAGKLIVSGNGTTTGIGFQTQDSSFTALVSMFDNGNVGINSANPRGKLSIVGGDTFLGNSTFNNTSVNEDLYVNSNLEVDGLIYGNATGLTNLISASGWTDGGTNVYTTTQTDNIGVGTTQPFALLDVSDVVAHGLGAVGAPSYTFRTDLDTGMWSSGANTLDFSTAGAQVIRVDSGGNVGIGTTVLQQRFVVAPPAAETITDGAVVTADGCGTIKRISSAGAVATNTTNTFSAPSSGYFGCCMDVINTGSNNITLDNNANFKSSSAGDVVLGASDTARVCSDGSIWYQLGTTGNN